MVDAKELGEAVLAMTATTTVAKLRTFEVRMADMPINAILALLAHGAQRKFNDAVGGADKSAETKVALAAAMIEEYKKGIVSKRREGVATTPEVTAARKIMRTMLPNVLTPEQLKTFRALEAGEQLAKLDEWATANADVIADEVEKELARLAAAAKMKEGLVGKVKVSL